MEIIIYEDNKDRIAILERKNSWEVFKKYRKGKFPHFLYSFLSIIASILVFIYFGIFEAFLCAFGLSVMLFIITELFGYKMFVYEVSNCRIKISKGDIIISYGAINEYLSCCVILRDKSNLLVLSDLKPNDIGMYISSRDHIFDRSFYSGEIVYEDINTDISDSLRKDFSSIRTSSDVYDISDIHSWILMNLISKYNKYVKNM